ncbi:ion transporter [Dyadobacter sp. 32]|uniref:ion transporter n=1 Tax=Dyadobacter sp. 32 TaxID=538966 RepID=UPI0011EE1E66
MAIDRNSLRGKLFIIIFGAHTKHGRQFDVFLLWFIVTSVLVVCLESVPSIRNQYHGLLHSLEVFFTIVFTIEYLLRLYSHPKPLTYFLSFFGIIDLLSIIPFYLTVILPAGHFLVTIRIIRLLRVFRILKLTSFVHHAHVLKTAIIASLQKITVFMLTIISLVLIIGTVMYVVEGEENGFTSIPQSIYWAIVTITTVGYGDLTPQTPLGQVISSVVMIMGYAIIAVPTGIVTVEMSRSMPVSRKAEQVECLSCGKSMPLNSNFCSNCGHQLNE